MLRKPLLLACLLAFSLFSAAQSSPVLFENVHVFNGRVLLPGTMHVLVDSGRIIAVGPSPAVLPKGTERIDGKGRTLMPGLIDVHVHMTFGALTMQDMMAPDVSEQTLLAKVGLSANKMLLRGFTSVRDMGGPIFPLKQAIDGGKIKGPRIWPSGAVISQTSGHGDFRTPDEGSRRFTGKPSRSELLGANFIADGRDEVLTATRENLRFGASQIKIMAGGGTSSAYDPVDVTQYTLDEMKAAVDAAEDWGTYVTVHAYTPRAVQRAITAGVKCIEHGQLLDEKTLQLMAQKKIWLSTQNLVEDTPDMDPLRREKRKPVIDGQKKLWPMAKRLGVKLAWGTDFLFEPELNDQQNKYILSLRPWFSNTEILKMVTHDNAQLLQLSGLRSPYPGKLGVIERGALADLILVDGDPVKNIELIAQPEKKFLVIMKQGEIIKNLLQ